MNRKITTLLSILIISNKVFSQKEEAIAAAAAGAVGILSTIAAYDAFVEKLENEATEGVHKERKEVKLFQLKLMNVRGEKLTNLSEISSCTFIVKLENGEKFVMMWIVGSGWWNEYGVVFDRIKAETFDIKRWQGTVFAMLKAGTNVTSLDEDSIPIYSTFTLKSQADRYWEQVSKKDPDLLNSSFPKVEKVTNEESYRSLLGIVSIKSLYSVSGSKFTFPNPRNPAFPFELKFDKLDGDSYSVSDFENLRVVYNERSLNIFFEDLRSLVKFRSSVFDDITKELLDLN